MPAHGEVLDGALHCVSFAINTSAHFFDKPLQRSATSHAPASCSQLPYCDAAPACTKAGASEADGFELLDDHAQL